MCTVHRQAGRTPYPLWWSAVSWCILRWGGALRSPSHTLPLDTTTLRLPHLSLSSPWSVAPTNGGAPSGPWASTRSPPNSLFHRVTPTAPPPYTLPPGTAPLLLFFLESSLSSPTTAKLCAGLGIPPPNCCCCRQLSDPSMETTPMVVRYQSWSGTRSYLPQSSVVVSRAWGAFIPPAYISLTCSGGYGASLLVIGSCSART